MNILEEANKLVSNDRQEQYSDPMINFKNISDIASLLCGRIITMDECIKVMMSVKLAREKFKHKRDNLVDLCGYTEILNRCYEDGE